MAPTDVITTAQLKLKNPFLLQTVKHSKLNLSMHHFARQNWHKKSIDSKETNSKFGKNQQNSGEKMHINTHWNCVNTSVLHQAILNCSHKEAVLI